MPGARDLPRRRGPERHRTSARGPGAMTASVVLQVISSTDRRGAEIFGVDLGDALHRRGRSVRTMALAPGRTAGLEVPTLGPSRFAPRTLRALRSAAATLVVAHGS